MPERPLTIATYAAGASLAAITLVYVFGPTFFLDDDAANSSRSSRKKGVVGLVNPANDCFINSILQALAGLPELRSFLIRETHRRTLDGPALYQDLAAALEEESKKQKSGKVSEWKLVGLQQGLVTAGLKDVLDALNERPIYRKTISAQSFIRVVEHAFNTRISRTQQDAQEFLQVIFERLTEEYQAASRVRRRSRQAKVTQDQDDANHDLSPLTEASQHLSGSLDTDSAQPDAGGEMLSDAKVGNHSTSPADTQTQCSSQHEGKFPTEGKLESQVECLHCHFQPKPSVSLFLVLTLNVPHNATSTTLNDCLDGMLKLEHIDDFTCDRCRLEHALQVSAKKLSSPLLAEQTRATLESDMAKIESALREDPEILPKGVTLPDLSTAPKRRISRHMRMSSFPQILAIHLSRSVWDPQSISTKNMAKVAFPETLPFGGLIDRKAYRLLAVVTHKGGHNSGHYESFRRQVLLTPFSTPASMGTEGVYSLKDTPAPTPRPSIASNLTQSSTVPSGSSISIADSRKSSFQTHSSLSSVSTGHAQGAQEGRKPVRTKVPLDAIPTPGLPSPPADRPGSEASSKPYSILSLPHGKSSKRKGNIDRWWRISDDKIKECKTSDVLGMQREVYLLFYEMVPEES